MLTQLQRFLQQESLKISLTCWLGRTSILWKMYRRLLISLCMQGMSSRQKIFMG